MLEVTRLRWLVPAAVCIIGLTAITLSGAAESEIRSGAEFRQVRTAAGDGADDSRTNPEVTGGRPAIGSRDQLLWEDFEEGAVPPSDWTLIQYNTVETWEIDYDDVFEGLYSASCDYDDTYTDDQDEWLISPVLDFSGKSDLKLVFQWMGSYYWAVEPYENCDLIVKITTDGSTWNDLWVEDSVGVFSSWTWYEAHVDLSAYVGETEVQIAFVYEGWDGAKFSIDAIDINDNPIPIGRCCYGDIYAPSCIDTTSYRCDELGGSWDDDMNCDDDPCPIPGPNDECEDAILVEGPYPVTIEGTTAGAAVDCPGVLDWNAVWYRFETICTWNEIEVSFCPSVPEFECVGNLLYRSCGDCYDYVEDNYVGIDDCGGGMIQPFLRFEHLPGPAPYYYPVFIGDAECNGIESDFSITFNISEGPPPPLGDNCEYPIQVTLDQYEDFYHWDYTCGRLDYYNNTCLGYYDNGEDIIFEVTMLAPFFGEVMVNPNDSWSGFLIDDECPPNQTECLYMATAGSSSEPYGLCGVHLDSGTYYIMVDTWPDPPCVEFQLIIDNAFNRPGNSCLYPIWVRIPSYLPYADLEQTTCERRDVDHGRCLSPYDDGEDVHYRLILSEPTNLTITMDPKSTVRTGMALDDDCPYDPDDCIAVVAGEGNDPRVMEVALDSGDYYLIIDTWPEPECIPDFDLTITLGPHLDHNPDTIDFGTVQQGSTGTETLILTNAGGSTLEYELFIDYGGRSTWLSVNPSAGSILAGESDSIAVTCDATGLLNDTWNANVIIEHTGDPSIDTVPVTMFTTGGESKAVFEPDPAYIYYKFAFNPIAATVYVGHFNDSHTADEIVNAGVNGVPATIAVVADQPGFVGSVAELTFPIAPFLDGYGAPFDTSSHTFEVTGSFDGGDSFSAAGVLDLIGKSSASGGERWIVPSDQVLLHGDVDLTGHIDIDDAVMTIELIFMGGQVYGSLMIADCNCSHGVDIDDIVYLVEYIFSGGPFPCHE